MVVSVNRLQVVIESVMCDSMLQLLLEIRWDGVWVIRVRMMVSVVRGQMLRNRFWIGLCRFRFSSNSMINYEISIEFLKKLKLNLLLWWIFWVINSLWLIRVRILIRVVMVRLLVMCFLKCKVCSVVFMLYRNKVVIVRISVFIIFLNIIVLIGDWWLNVLI